VATACPRRRSARHAVAALALTASIALTGAATASAATSQSQNQVITGTPTPQLVATFPGDFSFASFVPAATSSSTEQTINVKSNSSWGLRISADSANMRRWNGSAYVAGSLASPLSWAKTSQAGAPVGSPSYAAIATSTANVVTGQALTNDSGVDIGVTFQQPVSYGDSASIGTDVYRAVATYAAGQGF
jgi:hypothetical protein